MKLLRQKWSDRTDSMPVAFLDRDGTLIEHREVFSSIEEIRLLDGVVDGLRHLQDAGFALIVITNQPNVEKGLNSSEDIYAQHEHLRSLLAQQGVSLDAAYACPHKYTSTCPCRKPEQGMIEAAKADFDMDIERSWFIGDTGRDMETGKRAGLRTIFMKDGEGGNDPHFTTKGEFEVTNMLDASHIIEK